MATGVVQVQQIFSDGTNGPKLVKFQSLCYDYNPVNQEQAPEANCGSGFYQGSFMAIAGASLSVALTTEVRRLFSDTGLPAASVYLDPYFEIDPVFAASHPGYSLTFATGVGNGVPGALAVTPVPEPGTAALLAAGLFAIGVLRRRSERLNSKAPLSERNTF